MSKPQKAPFLSADLIASKGAAAPVSLMPRPQVVPPAIVEAEPAKAEPIEAIVSHNFRVPYSFKRAFDRAAFDEEMTGVKFIQHLFALYQQQKGKA